MANSTPKTHRSTSPIPTRWHRAQPLTADDWAELTTWFRSSRGPLAGYTDEDATDFVRREAYATRFDFYDDPVSEEATDLFVIHPATLGGSPIVLVRDRKSGKLREVEYAS